MIVFTVTSVIQAGREREALEHFRVLIQETRKEPGSMGYYVHRSAEDPRRFVLYEQWADQPALDRHRAAPHFMEHGVNGVQTLAESRTLELLDLVE